MRHVKLAFLAVLSLACVLALVFFLDSRSKVDPGTVAGTIGERPHEEGEPAATEGHRFLGPDGEVLPLRNDAEIEDFLRTAKVISSKRIDEGIHGVEKMLLEKDGIRAHAAFRDVKLATSGISQLDGMVSLGFRDDCIFEVAAYRISRLLGLDNVPPAVKRKFGRRNGTLQLWVEKSFTEKKRVREKLQAPSQLEWRRQVQTMYLFDQLIANGDRNQGNILIDGDWKIWMIDHTRAFRHQTEPRKPNIIVECDREVWERLQRLEPETVTEQLEGILTAREVRVMLKRRDVLVAHIRARIDRLGEKTVLFSGLRKGPASSEQAEMGSLAGRN